MAAASLTTTAGQLGDGTTTNRSAPVQVSVLTNVTEVAGGEFYDFGIPVTITVSPREKVVENPVAPSLAW